MISTKSRKHAMPSQPGPDQRKSLLLDQNKPSALCSGARQSVLNGWQQTFTKAQCPGQLLTGRGGYVSNEKRKYICLHQKQISIVLHSIPQHKTLAACSAAGLLDCRPYRSRVGPTNGTGGSSAPSHGLHEGPKGRGKRHYGREQPLPHPASLHSHC